MSGVWNTDLLERVGAYVVYILAVDSFLRRQRTWDCSLVSKAFGKIKNAFAFAFAFAFGILLRWELELQ